MDFPWKAMLFLLFMYFHCTSGYVRDRHEIVRRDVNLTAVDHSLGGALSMVFGPLADLADKVNLNIPLISNFRTKESSR
ncbi:uncharacterized protein LOC108040367 [Drosophila rhopaloa]|uniref:Uncharacterized protein LOC108040367 n=1 Tax=Drosophila rhopaloa TaxID=1041015 RepID=A0A6P4E5U8_DRORH|nr:uncharacterized protein LOC108040367 [Drosophila rhopaloa]